MRITKRQSIVAAILILTAFFASGTFFVRRNRPGTDAGGGSAGASSSAAASSSLAAPLEIPSAGKSMVVLNEFHRSETKDGRKLWEVTARQGHYFAETQSADLYDAKLLVYRKNGDTVYLDAKRAALTFSGFGLEKASLSEGMHLSLGTQVSLETAAAVYDKKQDTVVAPGSVKISNDVVEIKGEELHVNLDSQELSLARNVETVITPKGAAKKDKQ
jgi:LPS export ABC transporter protein LptC